MSRGRHRTLSTPSELLGQQRRISWAAFSSVVVALTMTAAVPVVQAPEPTASTKEPTPPPSAVITLTPPTTAPAVLVPATPPAIETPKAIPVADWVNPLPGRCNRTKAQGGTGYFGAPRDGGSRQHKGVDIVAPTGTPIHAAHSGTVSVGYEANAGNYLVINHQNGTWTIYMHLSKYEVKSGSVETNQVIGYVGATGDATGPHLHFETHTKLWSVRVNPITFMADRGVYLSC